MDFFTNMESAALSNYHMLMTTLLSLSFLGGTLLLLVSSGELVSFAEQINTRNDVTESVPCHFPRILHGAIDDEDRGEPESYNVARMVLFAPTLIGLVLAIVCGYGVTVASDASKSIIRKVYRVGLIGSSILLVCGIIINFLYIMETECGPINYLTHPETRNYTFDLQYNLDSSAGNDRFAADGSGVVSDRLNDELNSIYDLATTGFALIIGGALVASTLGVFHRSSLDQPLESIARIWAPGRNFRFMSHVSTHLIEWLFRLLVIIYVGRVFAFWSGWELDGHTGACSYDEIHAPKPSVLVAPLLKKDTTDCPEITNPYACMAEEQRFYALEVAENPDLPFSGTGVCSMTTTGRFAFESRNNTNDSTIVCGFDVSEVVPKACNHWKESMHDQVINSFIPSMIETNGDMKIQPSYSFAIPNVTTYTDPMENQDLFFTQPECWDVVRTMFNLGVNSTARCNAGDDPKSLGCQMKNFLLPYDHANSRSGEESLNAAAKTCCTVYVTNQKEPNTLWGNATLSPTTSSPNAPSVAPTATPNGTSPNVAPMVNGTGAPTASPHGAPSVAPTTMDAIASAHFFDRAGRSVSVHFGDVSVDTNDGTYQCQSLIGPDTTNKPSILNLMKKDASFNLATALAGKAAVEDVIDSHYEFVETYAESCKERTDDAYDRTDFEGLWTTAFVFILVEALFVVGSAVSRLLGMEANFMMNSAWYYYLTKLVFVLSKTFTFVVLIFVLNQNRNEGCPRFSPSSETDKDATLIGTFVFIQFIFLYLEGVTRLAWPGTHDVDGNDERSTVLSMSLL